MFVAPAAFQLAVPMALADEGDNFFLAMKLSTEAPWFLLTHRCREEGRQMMQTVAVAWETTLIDFVEAVGPSNVVSVQRMSSDQKTAGWAARELEEIWLPSEQELQETGPLVYRAFGEDYCRDSFEGRVPDQSGTRRLLLKLPR